MSNSIRINEQIIKVGDKFADWELIKVTSKPGGQYGEPTIKATFKKGNSTKNIDDITYYDGRGLREALGVSTTGAMPKSQNEFKKMFPAAASVFGWGGKRRKTRRRKSHKRRTTRK